MKDNKNNTGNRNTGNRNTGDLNTGNYNTGNRNTGDLNTGNRNTGNLNTGNRNTGNYNTGNYNTGYCNTGNRNTGIFCTIEPAQTLFNKPTNLMFNSVEIQNIILVINLVKPIVTWIYSQNMTDEEKTDNPSHKTIGGYLKKQDYKYCWKKSWESFTKEKKDIILNAPNFDATIFKEITGIDIGVKKQVTLELTDEQLEKIRGVINN